MIWILRLDEALAEVRNGDLLEENKLDELNEVWWRRRFLSLWCFQIELFLIGDFDLLDDDKLFLVHLSFYLIFENMEGLWTGTGILVFVKDWLSRLRFHGSNFSFSCYYCFSLLSTNNREQVLKTIYLIFNLY